MDERDRAISDAKFIGAAAWVCVGVFVLTLPWLVLFHSREERLVNIWYVLLSPLGLAVFLFSISLVVAARFKAPRPSFKDALIVLNANKPKTNRDRGALVLRLGWIALSVYLGLLYWPTSLAWAGEHFFWLFSSLGLLAGPLGWVSGFLGTAIKSAFRESPERILYIVEWSLYAVSGYIQWFVLLPKVWRKKSDGET